MTRRGALAFQRAVGTAADSLWRYANKRLQPPPSGERLASAFNTWDSIESFYSEAEVGELRRRSGERDYGCHWRDGAGFGPWWRISLVVDTGELYAFCLAGAEWCPEAGQVRLLATGLTRDSAELRLEGWGEMCGQPHSLKWLDDRLALPEVRRCT